MKLSDWAKKEGLCYRTAYNLFKANKLPVKAKQLKTGTILVEEYSDISENKYVIYSRVSSHDQKEDLKRQTERLRDFCSSHGFPIDKEYEEIASGLNQKRVKLNKILKDKTITHIIVENKDRLTRFGFELIESSLKSSNRKIIVINNAENKTDLVQDFIDITTSLCAKIYGQRSAKNRAKRALESTQQND